MAPQGTYYFMNHERHDIAAAENRLHFPMGAYGYNNTIAGTNRQ